MNYNIIPIQTLHEEGDRSLTGSVPDGKTSVPILLNKSTNDSKSTSATSGTSIAAVENTSPSTPQPREMPQTRVKGSSVITQNATLTHPQSSTQTPGGTSSATAEETTLFATQNNVTHSTRQGTSNL